MSLSPCFPWPSASPGPSIVPHWLLHHIAVITILMTAMASPSVSSNYSDSLCSNPSEFPHLMHTIGLIDGALWAISNDKWNVYELVPCKGNDSIGHCMHVNPHSNTRSPVSVDAKWPKLVEAVKNATQKTDFSFSVNNSFVIDSSKFGHTVLIMNSSSLWTTFFGFDFGTNQSFPTRCGIDASKTPDLWISSDAKDKAYRLYESGNIFQLLYFLKKDNFISNNPNSTKFICNSTKQDGLEVMFSKDNCALNVSWTVVKGVQFRNHFYFFSPYKVYIFSDKALNESTKVLTVSYEDFLQCNNPTSLSPPHHSTSNSTNSSSFTTNGHKVTTVKESNKTILIIVVVVVGIVILLLVAVAMWCCYFYKDAKKVQNVKGTILGDSAPTSTINSGISGFDLPNELKKASSNQSDSLHANDTKLIKNKHSTLPAQSQSRAKPLCKDSVSVANDSMASSRWSQDGTTSVFAVDEFLMKKAPVTKMKDGLGKKTQKPSQSKQNVHSKQSNSAAVTAKGSLKNPLPNNKAKGGF